MCGCTLYDSPTCGHSWISMSQPCGFLADLLNCPHRQIYQTLIAPPYTCPTCNGGFADQETIEMVQGPWGCNQMIRNHVGGNHAIPGQWGNAQIMAGGLAGPAITSGAVAGAMIPTSHVNQGFASDHRLTGPYGPAALGPAIATNGPIFHGNRLQQYDDVHLNRHHGYYVDERSKRRRHKSHYKYKYTDRPAPDCTVM
ncbi:hypothetical protein ACJQWK_02438 [Exserohilum turcicum]|uniref:Uncharacterized protein n=1 Tax=Exserohilum turcicum (strain 28A) TaxID=671987 RepID=R0KKI0_EXST2|nr:uncharacterized protein SETTUDRAFT_159218 [Exserohilum turcica Et28A]EOA89619.1 hypothetical protein SETTUDRAFT_159218 [Exserohilum turcica Et28A]